MSKLVFKSGRKLRKLSIRSKRHGKRTAEVLFGSAISFINGLFFTAEEDFGDTIPAHFERIQKISSAATVNRLKMETGGAA